MAKHYRRFFGALLPLVLLLAACGGDDDDTGTTAAAATTTEATAAAPFAFSVETIDYAFQNAPQEIPAGVIEVTVDNTGAVAHEFGLVEIGDATVEQFVTDFPPVLEGGPFPAYAGAAMGPIEVEAGGSGTATFTVTEPGNYVVFCALTGDAAGTPAEGEEEPREPRT